MCVCALLLDTFANLLHRLTKHAVAIGIIILMMSLWELSLPLFVLHLKWLFYRLKVEVLVCCRLFQACFYVNTKSLLICILQLRIIIYFLTKKNFRPCIFSVPTTWQKRGECKQWHTKFIDWFFPLIFPLDDVLVVVVFFFFFSSSPFSFNNIISSCYKIDGKADMKGKDETSDQETLFW